MTDEPSLNLTIGAAIREARLSRGVTQDDLARLLGVDRTMVSRYERGQRTLSAPALLHIFRYLQYPLSTLDGKTITPPQAEVAPPVQKIVQMLTQRPDLIPTVEDVLDTFLAADQ